MKEFDDIGEVEELMNFFTILSLKFGHWQ